MTAKRKNGVSLVRLEDRVDWTEATPRPINGDSHRSRQAESESSHRFERDLWDVVASSLDIMGIGIALLDDKGQMSLVNRSAERILALEDQDSDSATYSAFGDLLTQELSLPQALKRNINLPEIYTHIPGAHGTWLSVLFSPVRSREGGEKASLVLFRDISDIKKKEHDCLLLGSRLNETQAELEHTRRLFSSMASLKSLGEMASGLIHEFNNFLLPIIGYSELLLDKLPGPDEEKLLLKYLKVINDSAQGAANTARHMRTLYKLEDVLEPSRPQDLNGIVNLAVLLTRPKWKDQTLIEGRVIHAETELTQTAEIRGKKNELLQAIINLIFNAVDAMPEGGTLLLKTRHEDMLVDHEFKKFVVLEVSDTGVGMAREVVAQCWEAFFTTKGEHGTGLGLGIVREIVKSCGGSIDIETEPGKGTTFVVRFPSADQKKDSAETSKVTPIVRPLNVLAVDDDPLVLEYLTNCLSRDGHSVETAVNGRDGLQKFHESWFDLVITDKAMPEINGDRLATSIKRVAPNKPIIMLTGFGALVNASDDQPTGIDLTLVKPVGPEDLRIAISKVVNRHSPTGKQLTS